MASCGHFDGPGKELVAIASEVLQVCGLSPFIFAIALVLDDRGIELATLGVKLVTHASTISTDFKAKRFELEVNLRANIVVQLRA